MFLQADIEEFNIYHILSNLWSSSNHASLLLSNIIKEEFIQERKQSIVRNSEKERKFIDELRNRISNVDMTNILNYDMLEHVTWKFATIAEDLENKYSGFVNITKYSKTWWNKECNRDLASYWASRKRIDWINYKKLVKIAKQVFFYNK